MAQSSAVFSGAAGTGAQYQTLYLDFWLISQDINNNRSKFGYQAKVASVVGGAGETYGGAYSFSGAYATSASGLYWSWGSGGLVIASGEFTVAHSADGTLSKRTLTVSASYATYSGTASASTSVTLTIPTIPRATMPTAPSSHTLGNEMTISTPRASSAFTHTLKYSFHGASGTIATGVSTSAKWTPPETLANKIPNYTSGTCTITCETYHGSKHIGSKSTVVQLHLWSARVPTITAVEITEAVANVSNKFSVWVQNKSKARVKTTSEGIYSSTIKRVVVTVLGTSYSGSDITTNTLNKSGNVNIEITVTDTRGRTASETVTIIVEPWTQPKIMGLSATRAYATGEDADDGWNARIHYKYQISPVSDQNDSEWRVEHWKNSSWELVQSGTGYSADTNFLSAALFDPDFTQRIRLVVTDYFGQSSAEFSIPTSSSILDFKYNKKGLAIGKASELDAFECAWPAYFTGGLQSNGSPVITEASNSLLESGYFTADTQSNQVYTEVINFTKPFYASPVVISTPVTSAPNRVFVSVSARSKTSIEIKVWKDWTGIVTVGWLAVEP